MGLLSRGPEQTRGPLELGLLAPVVLVAVFAAFQYGYLYWSIRTASVAAHEAARALMIGTDWSCARDRAAQAAQGPATGPEAPLVLRRYHHEDGTEFTGPVRGALVTVTVSFRTMDIGVPFLPLPDQGTVSRSVTARVENVPPVALPCL